ncbi:FtsX-like permease family protein [Bacillus spongiae]|uniref:FtsX-like permease family protein n=1 Tax=Bacillus spongiae TaxID=2683610 RepID=A0ABU8HDS9_9BACI
MHIINKLTVRHLKENKKRTLVTMVGVVIAVAMLTAVATIGFSFIDLAKRQSIINNGEWHVQYENVNKAQLGGILNDDNTESVVISRDVGYASLQNSQNKKKPYLFITEYNSEEFEKFPIELSEGRLPQSPNEVVLSEEIAENGKVEYIIGDTLSLGVGDRVVSGTNNEYKLLQSSPFGNEPEDLKTKTTSEYTVVGFIKRPTWEPSSAPGYTIISYIDEGLIKENDIVTASVLVKEVDKSIYGNANALAEKNNIEVLNFNNSLLRFYGVTDDAALQLSVLLVIVIMIGVIMIGSIALIYNAFAISVSERTRHLGMLSSVGATKRQKRNSVLFEGALIGIISIPIGLISGLIGIGITFYFINSIISDISEFSEQLTVVVTPLSIFVALAVSVLTIFISTYIPAKKASRISAIDAIRQASDVKLSGKAVKTSKLIRKLFGFEAEIGLKNLKRNKRKYRATIFSLVISIVLFLTVSFFNDDLKKSLGGQGIDYDIRLEYYEENDSYIQKVDAMNEVTEYSELQRIYGSASIDISKVPNEILEASSGNTSKQFNYSLNVIALDDKDLMEYANDVGANYEGLQSTDRVSGIIINSSVGEIDEKQVQSKTMNAEAGDRFSIKMGGENSPSTEITIAALTDQLPLGVNFSSMGELQVIVSKASFNELYNMHGETIFKKHELFLKSKEPMATQYELEPFIESSTMLNNVYEERVRAEQLQLILSIFTYGFIVLITLISVTNILNTISTSVSLRKREFAMLKSVGISPKGFNKMIQYESIFYGLKALLYGIPISILFMYLIHLSWMNKFVFEFEIPFTRILFVIAVVLIIVTALMRYSSAKIKKENIIEALKQENI